MEKTVNNLDDNSDITNNIDSINTEQETQKWVDFYLNWDKNKDVLSNNSIEQIKLAIMISPTTFQNFILEKLSNSQPITNWQEWEIYKFKYEWGEYVIAKKRFDTESRNEHKLHKKAHQISLESNSWIKIPEPIYEFHNEENWYIIMEYIEWQTLYTLIWEEIINQNIISQIKLKLWNQESNRFNEFKKEYIKNWKVYLKNDSVTEKLVMELLEILHEVWWNVGYPNTYVKDENKPHIKRYPVLENIYKKYVDKINLFDEKNWKKITDNLKIFLEEMHSEGIYHRDLWWNPRNIMFTKKWDKIEVNIIDFWMWIETEKWAQCDYHDNITWWVYDNDNNIITIINSLKWDKNENKQNTINDIEKNDIISKWKNLWLNINENLIDININISKRTNLESVLDDFIAWKDRMYNWFIYLKNKLDAYEQKTTSIWHNKLFIFIQLLDEENKSKLKTKVDELLLSSKRSKKYKYAELFDKYLNA